MKYKRLASKLGVKKFEPGALISKMHSIKGMPKKKHKSVPVYGRGTTGNVGGTTYNPQTIASTGSGKVLQGGTGGARSGFNLQGNYMGGEKFKKSKKHKFGTDKGLKKPFAKKHKKVNDNDEDDKFKKHKEVDFKKHKACMKKHKHDKSCE
jgi:hypothetical protein